MTAQEIFNSTAVRSVEEQILDLYHETERKHWYNDENKKAIKSLLEVRRRILNSMFVLDEQNKQLLAEFNEAMKQQLIEMRKRAIDLYYSISKLDKNGRIDVIGITVCLIACHTNTFPSTDNILREVVIVHPDKHATGVSVALEIRSIVSLVIDYHVFAQINDFGLE